MTEDEAKTKWCPLTRLPAGWIGKAPHEPTPKDPLYATAECIGSRCMMWRHTETGKRATGKEVVRIDAKGMRHLEPEYEDVPVGHCGLSGKP